LPTGVVTFVFTDIEGSTRLIRTQPDFYTGLLERHREILRTAFHDGVEFGAAGDALYYAFDQPDAAIAAAVDGQRALAREHWRNVVGLKVRMGVSTGSVGLLGDDYVGLEIHRVARICAAAHGGQVVVSQSVKNLVRESTQLVDLGDYSLAGLTQPERLYQLIAEGLATEFPPLRVKPVASRRIGRLHHPRQQAISLDAAVRQLRTALPEVAPDLRTSFTDLAARLFTAARAAEYATTFLARVDRDGLAKRLRQQRETAVYSEKAGAAAAKTERQIESVATVAKHSTALQESGVDVPELVTDPTSISARRIHDVEERVAGAMSALDEAIIRAVMLVDPLCYKLQRTRHRGVYRDGADYVVPYVNHLGLDSLRSFSSARDARDFREAIRILEKSGRGIRRDPGRYVDHPEDRAGGAV
jgi:class 3 adenylate cyclase